MIQTLAAADCAEAPLVARADRPTPPPSPVVRVLALASHVVTVARASLDTGGPAGLAAWALQWLTETDADTDADGRALALLAALVYEVEPAAPATPADLFDAVLHVEEATHVVVAEAARLVRGLPEADRPAVLLEAVAVAEGEHAEPVRLGALILLEAAAEPDPVGDAARDITGLLDAALRVTRRYDGAEHDGAFNAYVEALRIEAMESAADGDVAGNAAAGFLIDALNTDLR